MKRIELIPGRIEGGNGEPVWPNIPKDMVLNAFYMHYDRSEGWLGDSHLCLWSRAEIANYASDLAKYFGEDILFFGSDGGGTMFGFKQLEGGYVFLSSPAIGDVSDIRILGDWNSFISALEIADYI